MNWLGKIIQKHVNDIDTILDIGCGIMQATTGSLNKDRASYFGSYSIKCRSYLGIDIIKPYLDVAKQWFPVVRHDVRKLNDILVEKSFDVILILDVIEHLSAKDANELIITAMQTARKKVIIYTPKEFHTNEQNIENAWGLGENIFQKHLSYISPDQFRLMGFNVTFPEPDKNTLAVYDF